MGYDASVYLIYGVHYEYNHTNIDSIKPILNLIVPDLLEEYGDDVWNCFDDDPHTNGYYCLNFTDNVEQSSQLFIACYKHEHKTSRGANDNLEVNLPSKEKMNQFRTWCKNNGITQRPTFYTKLYESY